MPNQPYFRIWRPGCDEACFADRRNSAELDELAGDYAQLENRLRQLLHRSPALLKDTTTPHAKLLGPLQQLTFEVQHNLFGLLKANGAKPHAHDVLADFLLADKALRLAEYKVSIRLEAGEKTTVPFAVLAAGTLPAWYLADASPFRPKRRHLPAATLPNLLDALAGLRCLLYAQFGTLPDALIAPNTRNTGTGLFTAQSLFSVTPAVWVEEEHYSFSWAEVKNQKQPFVHYPFAAN